jgi:CBS domain-containing membrane protein
MTPKFPDKKNKASDENVAEIELTDDDIVDAMRHIAGYLDITAEDFREIYHLAHRHALNRLFVGVTAGSIMRTAIQPLQMDTTLERAARIIVESGCKGLPVVDAGGKVVGMLTEIDFLKRMKEESFLGLMLKMLDDSFEFTRCCHASTVSQAMTQPALTVGADAGFVEMMVAYRRHEGRSMPVVDENGKLLGLLLRKDFFAAFHFEELL